MPLEIKEPEINVSTLAFYCNNFSNQGVQLKWWEKLASLSPQDLLAAQAAYNILSKNRTLPFPFPDEASQKNAKNECSALKEALKEKRPIKVVYEDKPIHFPERFFPLWSCTAEMLKGTSEEKIEKNWNSSGFPFKRPEEGELMAMQESFEAFEREELILAVEQERIEDLGKNPKKIAEAWKTAYKRANFVARLKLAAFLEKLPKPVIRSGIEFLKEELEKHWNDYKLGYRAGPLPGMHGILEARFGFDLALQLQKSSLPKEGIGLIIRQWMSEFCTIPQLLELKPINWPRIIELLPQYFSKNPAFWEQVLSIRDRKLKIEAWKLFDSQGHKLAGRLKNLWLYGFRKMPSASYLPYLSGKKSFSAQVKKEAEMILFNKLCADCLSGKLKRKHVEALIVFRTRMAVNSSSFEDFKAKEMPLIRTGFQTNDPAIVKKSGALLLKGFDAFKKPYEQAALVLFFLECFKPLLPKSAEASAEVVSRICENPKAVQHLPELLSPFASSDPQFAVKAAARFFLNHHRAPLVLGKNIKNCLLQFLDRCIENSEGKDDNLKAAANFLMMPAFAKYYSGCLGIRWQAIIEKISDPLLIAAAYKQFDRETKEIYEIMLLSNLCEIPIKKEELLPLLEKLKKIADFSKNPLINNLYLKLLKSTMKEGPERAPGLFKNYLQASLNKIDNALRRKKGEKIALDCLSQLEELLTILENSDFNIQNSDAVAAICESGIRIIPLIRDHSRVIDFLHSLIFRKFLPDDGAERLREAISLLKAIQQPQGLGNEQRLKFIELLFYQGFSIRPTNEDEKNANFFGICKLLDRLTQSKSDFFQHYALILLIGYHKENVDSPQLLHALYKIIIENLKNLPLETKKKSGELEIQSTCLYLLIEEHIDLIRYFKNEQLSEKLPLLCSSICQVVHAVLEKFRGIQDKLQDKKQNDEAVQAFYYFKQLMTYIAEAVDEGIFDLFPEKALKIILEIYANLAMMAKGMGENKIYAQLESYVRKLLLEGTDRFKINAFIIIFNCHKNYLRYPEATEIFEPLYAMIVNDLKFKQLTGDPEIDVSSPTLFLLMSMHGRLLKSAESSELAPRFHGSCKLITDEVLDKFKDHSGPSLEADVYFNQLAYYMCLAVCKNIYKTAPKEAKKKLLIIKDYLCNTARHLKKPEIISKIDSAIEMLDPVVEPVELLAEGL